MEENEVYGEWQLKLTKELRLSEALLVDSDLLDDPDAGFNDGNLTIPSGDLKAIFDDVIEQILVLIAEQVQDVTKSGKSPDKITIILVGGFGSNLYLRERVEETFRHLNVIHPPDS